MRRAASAWSRYWKGAAAIPALGARESETLPWPVAYSRSDYVSTRFPPLLAPLRHLRFSQISVPESPMVDFKSQRRLLRIRGRVFHFASHRGRTANLKRFELPFPAMWYLMVEGRRCPVFPCDSIQGPVALDQALRSWAADNALGPVEQFAPPHLLPVNSPG